MFKRNNKLPETDKKFTLQNPDNEQKSVSKSKKLKTNFFASLSKKITDKYIKKNNKKKDNVVNSETVINLKNKYKWTEIQRIIEQLEIEETDINDLERFFIRNLDMKNSFNKIFAEQMGREFLQSFFCLPVYVVRYQSPSMRLMLNHKNLNADQHQKVIFILFNYKC